MKKIDWNKYRHDGIGHPERKGEIDLVSVYMDVYQFSDNRKPIDFLLHAMSIQPIMSRQTAAIALAMAKHISER